MNILDFRKENSNFKKSVVWAILVFLFLLITSKTFSQDKVKFYAAGVTCSMCSSAIHSSLKTDKSISKIDPNLQTQEWYLEYKTGEFKIENLKKRVEDSGFSITKLWLNGELVFDITKSRKRK